MFGVFILIFVLKLIVTVMLLRWEIFFKAREALPHFMEIRHRPGAVRSLESPSGTIGEVGGVEGPVCRASELNEG